jgi:hypothetical protein
MEIQLDNAQEMQKLYPDTFRAPSALQIGCLRPDDLIKICGYGERFWAIIKEVVPSSTGNPFDTVFVATVDNDLIGDAPCAYGDKIKVRGYEVYQISMQS